jgi:serine/threonine protein kinase
MSVGRSSPRARRASGRDSSHARAAPIGSIVAGYRIIELIGGGSGGAVYLAEQEQTGERVALKVLADELAQDDRFRRRFLRQSTIAAGLRHPHVVGILDFGEADGVVYLAMRHIEGADLRELLGRDGIWILLVSVVLWTRGRGLSRLATDAQPLGEAA